MILVGGCGVLMGDTMRQSFLYMVLGMVILKMGFINIVFVIKSKITFNVGFIKSSKNIENSSFEKLKMF